MRVDSRAQAGEHPASRPWPDRRMQHQLQLQQHWRRRRCANIELAALPFVSGRLLVAALNHQQQPVGRRRRWTRLKRIAASEAGPIWPPSLARSLEDPAASIHLQQSRGLLAQGRQLAQSRPIARGPARSGRSGALIARGST